MTASAADAKWGSIAQFTEKSMKRAGVPGVAVGILHKGETATGGFGVTNVDHPLPVTPTTLFQIGSISKTYTATALMRLVDAGKIELDARVRRYIPDFELADEDAAANVTVRHLLTHMGGWDGDMFDDTGNGDNALADYVAKVVKRPQMAPLGTVWSYNNTAFSIAGYILQLVCGKSYEAVMQEQVFGPLGLKSTYLEPTDVMTLRYACGHGVGPDGPVVAKPWALPRAVGAAGRIISDVGDMLKYAAFHLGDGTTPDGTRLLTQAAFTQMHTPQVRIFGKESRGIAFSIDDTHGARRFGHGGGTVGQISLLTMVPDHGFAVAVVTNANEGGTVAKQVTEYAIKEYLGIDTPGPKEIEASEAQLKEVVGRYVRPRDDIYIGVLGGKLVAQQIPTAGFPNEDSPVPPAPPPFPLGFCDRDRLLITAGPLKDMMGDIVRKPDGSIGWIRLGGRIHKREA